MRLVVLGGSSPFAVGLVDALAKHGGFLQKKSLVLFGRNEENLYLIMAYAKNALKTTRWQVSASLDISTALEEADVVLHQIRYGDLAGRARDEAFANQWQVHTDESLGVAGFHSVIRALPTLKKFSGVIADVCPNAWVLNLTNPMSLVTALMIEAGIDKNRCLGLCELPFVTVSRAVDRLGISSAEIDWSYAGLNHRGFIVRLEYQGKDIMKEYLYQFGTEIMDGIPADLQDSLGAIPMKYFRVYFGDGKETMVGRAEFLINLRKKISEELHHDITRTPPSLNLRQGEWYSKAVVPILAALFSEQSELHIVNLLTSEGIVEEFQARVSRTSIKPIAPPKVNDVIESWLKVFRGHESAQLHALRFPSLASFTMAASRDPLIPETHVESVGQELWLTYQKCQDAKVS